MIDALKATALITTLLFSGASYAANKIALICSGTETVDWQKESTNPLLEPDGLVIDLDGGVVVWRNVTIPIVKTSGVWIEFESKEQAEALDSHSYSGIIDRVTGGVGITENWVRESWENTDFDIPPEQRIKRTERFTYNLTCKPAKPLF